MRDILELMEAIFGPSFISTDNANKPLFSGFSADPLKSNGWIAKTMHDGKMPSVISKNNNNYFSLATYRPNPEGEYRAKKEYVAAMHGVLLDDLGTKSNSKVKLKLSWKIETSPGNFQGGYILRNKCTDTKRYEAIVKALGLNGWSDPGASGIARWARLPFGLNTKDKYLVDGKAPEVKLIALHEKRRYSLDQIVDAFGLDLGGDSNNSVTSAISLGSDGDAVLSAIKTAGLLKGTLEPGKHDITCPWVHLHTDKNDHGTVYFEASDSNQQSGGFKCQHGHCAERSISDLKAHLGISKIIERTKHPVETAIECTQDLQVFADENGETFCFINGQCYPTKSQEVRAHLIEENQKK